MPSRKRKQSINNHNTTIKVQKTSHKSVEKETVTSRKLTNSLNG